MNNTQLFVTIGVPFFTLLLVYIASTISNRATVNDLRSEMRAGFESLNKRMDRMEQRNDHIESKLDRIMEEVFREHEGRLSKLEDRVFARLT